MTPLSLCPTVSLLFSFSLSARFAFSPFALWPSLAVARSDNRKKREFLQRAARCRTRNSICESRRNIQILDGRAAQQCARVIAASPRCRSRVFARILNNFSLFFRKRRVQIPGASTGHAKIARCATGEWRAKEEGDAFWESFGETARFLGSANTRLEQSQDPPSDERRETVEDRGKERRPRAARRRARRTLGVGPRVPASYDRACNGASGSETRARSERAGEHLPISGNMLGWSSSDLRLFSTRVGEERSLSLISRTAPRSLQAHTSGLPQRTRGDTLDGTHRARVV